MMMNRRHLCIRGAVFAAIGILVFIICAYRFQLGKCFPVEGITPREMVKILQTKKLDDVSTAHNGEIWVETKLGFRYETTWQPIPDTDYENITDSLNLVVQILEKERGLESGKDFELMCE